MDQHIYKIGVLRQSGSNIYWFLYSCGRFKSVFIEGVRCEDENGSCWTVLDINKLINLLISTDFLKRNDLSLVCILIGNPIHIFGVKKVDILPHLNQFAIGSIEIRRQPDSMKLL